MKNKFALLVEMREYTKKKKELTRIEKLLGREPKEDLEIEKKLYLYDRGYMKLYPAERTDKQIIVADNLECPDWTYTLGDPGADKVMFDTPEEVVLAWIGFTERTPDKELGKMTPLIFELEWSLLECKMVFPSQVTDKIKRKELKALLEIVVKEQSIDEKAPAN